MIETSNINSGIANETTVNVIKSDMDESFESHGERVFDMIQDRNRFVHGIDKSCNGFRSILKVLSECEGMPMADAIGIALCDTGLTLRTVQDKIRGFRARKIIANTERVQFLDPYKRKVGIEITDKDILKENELRRRNYDAKAEKPL
jgi:hypothetical protein